ncbi:MAG: hypothetical protein ACI9HK_004779, partial [Pirellulaceae bacterium]
MYARSLLLFACISTLLVASNVATSTVHARTRIEAVSGEPFGVAVITVDGLPDVAAALKLNELSITEANQRALYPAFTAGVPKLLGNRNGGTGPVRELSVLFLFKGNQPFTIRLEPLAASIDVVPQPGQRNAHSRLLTKWWRQYHANVRQQLDEGDYPPVVETYLTSMLSRRLNLQTPLLSRSQDKQSSEPQQALERLLGLENIRIATLRDGARAGNASGEADVAVPTIDWAPPRSYEFDANVDIESIATRVPEECFYIRFGSFANHLWMTNLLERYGGDIGGMVQLRGNRPELSLGIQRQLGLETNALSELLGGQVIKDMALVGRDLYMREGAAIGVLFEERNGLLATNFATQRQSLLAKNEDATLKTIEMEGKKVSFLSTADNRLRSYYARDGKFHFITTSREVARRFLQTSSGRRTLAGMSEFKYARTTMPNSLKHTVFLYFSSKFWEGLVSPHYHVELTRRLQAATDIEMVQLAQLAASNEGVAGDTIDELVKAQLLPVNFGRRGDGSGPIIGPIGVIDSKRGERGLFTPIPDVEVSALTKDEATRYQEVLSRLQDQWRQMDPVMLGVRRFALNREGKERLVIDAEMTPTNEEKYGFLMSMIGPPVTHKVSPVAGDIISVQASLRGGLLSPAVRPHQMFLGIQDTQPITNLRPTGFWETLQVMKSAPAYLGSRPKAGFMDFLPILGGGQPDEFGYSKLLFGLWRWQRNDFSVLSFDPAVLQRVSPHLGVEETDDPAQIRVHVGDLKQSQLSGWINSLAHQRARAASVGNVRLINSLSQQLSVPRGNAKQVANHLLDTELTCSLG